MSSLSVPATSPLPRSPSSSIASTPPPASPPSPKSSARPACPGPLAARDALDLSPRSFRTAFGGLFLFLPALVQLDFPALVRQAGLPGSDRIPPDCAALALLALKLWGVGRPLRVMPDALDEGLALFAGLNAIPKRSTLSEYSARVDPRRVPAFTASWLDAAESLAALPRGSSFDLDFHTVPCHGHKALIEKHFVSDMGAAQGARDALASVQRIPVCD